ncbi:hypothetical protein TSMEX_004546 [Taenia solium]|eukprot:TsM_001226300 transcript=TsM_001226300 gene=TsM_001226300
MPIFVHNGVRDVSCRRSSSPPTKMIAASPASPSTPKLLTVTAAYLGLRDETICNVTMVESLMSRVDGVSDSDSSSVSLTKNSSYFGCLDAASTDRQAEWVKLSSGKSRALQQPGSQVAITALQPLNDEDVVWVADLPIIHLSATA